MNLLRILPTIIFFWLTISQSLVVGQLTADYSLDSNSFLATNATARSAVEAALSDLNEVLNLNLTAVNAVDQNISVTSGGITIQLQATTQIRHPRTNQLVTVPIGHNESIVRIFLGTRNLGTALGNGATGNYRFNFTVPNFIFFSVDELVDDTSSAVQEAENTFNSIYLRGNGPVVVSATSNVALTSNSGQQLVNVPIRVNFGVLNGRISIDDTMSRFHLDHTTPPPSGSSDLYTVVLHEALHAIGFVGGSAEWGNNVNGTNWTGSEVIRSHGTGTGVIHTDGDHVNPELLSARITDGQLQQSVLAPVIPRGVRLRLTEFDVALMQDLNFSNAEAPPKPPAELGDFDLDGDVDLADLDRFNSNIGANAVGLLSSLDLNGNDTVDQEDFETHYTTLVQTSNGNTGTAAGDINLDGIVNVLGDAIILVNNLGGTSATSWGQGDLDADGRVTVLGDALLLVTNLGANNG